MHKALIALFTVGLLVAGSAFAQGMGSNMFAGVSFGYANAGYPIPEYFFPIGAHFGIDNVGVQNLAVRGDVEYMLGQIASTIRFGADALYSYPVMTDLSVYGGIGPSLLLGTGIISGQTWIGVRVSAGAEYMVTSNIGVTGEANLTPYFTNGSPFLYGFSLGANYHF